MKTGLFAVFDSQKSKDWTAGLVFSSFGLVWLQSFCSLETGLTNTNLMGEDKETKVSSTLLSSIQSEAEHLLHHFHILRIHTSNSRHCTVIQCRLLKLCKDKNIELVVNNMLVLMGSISNDHVPDINNVNRCRGSTAPLVIPNVAVCSLFHTFYHSASSGLLISEI